VKYAVVIEPAALHDMEMIFAWTRDRFGKGQAAHYQTRLKQSLRALKEMPERNPIAPESAYLGETTHQQMHHPFRVLFVIRKPRVHVLYIRHAARLPVGMAEQK
jgi:plasmid stabilization system protein ParE